MGDAHIKHQLIQLCTIRKHFDTLSCFQLQILFKNYTSISSYSWSLGTQALISWPRKIPIFCSSSLPLHAIQEWILTERSEVEGRADFAHCCHRMMGGHLISVCIHGCQYLQTSNFYDFINYVSVSYSTFIKIHIF